QFLNHGRTHKSGRSSDKNSHTSSPHFSLTLRGWHRRKPSFGSICLGHPRLPIESVRLTTRNQSSKTENASVWSRSSLDNRRLSPVTFFFEMPEKRPKTVGRKPRTDAQRNRERILQVAKDAFTRFGGNVSLDDVAKQARVGPGTLYRHFPTRDALL